MVELSCVASIEGCHDCELEDDYKVRKGHDCGQVNAAWVRLCDMERHFREESEELHRMSHQPLRCQACKAKLRNAFGYDVLVSRPCKAGFCNEWLCPYCGEVAFSDGPVSCPTCGSFAGRSSRVSRMRHEYRRRRRFW